MKLTFRRTLSVALLPAVFALFAIAVTQVFAISFTYGDTIMWGGTQHDYVTDMARDAGGNKYVVGTFRSISGDFDPGVGTSTQTTNGLQDIYISKFNVADEHVWTRTLGGTDVDEGFGVAVDNANSAIYVTASFKGTVDVEPGGSTINETAASVGYSDALILKLDMDGNYWLHETIGGAQNDVYTDIAIDSEGNTYVSGWTDSLSVDLDPGAGTETLTNTGSQAAFVTKFDNSFNHLWSKKIDGASMKSYEHVEVVGQSFYLLGYLTSSSNVDYDPGAGTDNHLAPSGNATAIVSKYALDGTYGWTRSLGDATGPIYQKALATDLSGAVYFGGYFLDTSVDFDPTAGTDLKAGSGTGNAYLSKYNADGSYGWTRVISTGEDEDTVQSIDVSAEGAVFAAGFVGGYNSYDFDGTAGTDTISLAADAAFITQYASDGDYGDTIVLMEDNYTQQLNAMIVNNNTIWIGGNVEDPGVDFDGTAGTDVLTATNNDGFITRYHYSAAALPDSAPAGAVSTGTFDSGTPTADDPLLEHKWTYTWGGTGNENLRTFTQDANGNVLAAGTFTSPYMDYDPTDGTDIREEGAPHQLSLVVKFTPAGEYEWSQNFTGTKQMVIDSIDTDSTGAVYVAGLFRGTVDLDPGEAVVSSTSHASGTEDSAFLVKLTANGEYVWSKVVGGDSGGTQYLAVSVDSTDRVIVGGSTNVDVSIDLNPDGDTDTKTISSGAPSSDSFISVFSADGTYVFSRVFYGDNTDSLASVEVGNDDAIYIGGTTRSTSLNIEDGDPETNSTGNSVGYFIKYDSSGNFVWSVLYGGENEGVSMYTMDLDEEDNIYAGAEYYEQTDFDGTSGTDLYTPADDYGDPYVVKYDSDGNYVYTISVPNAETYEETWYVDASGGYLYFGGYSEGGSLDYDPTSGVDTVESNTDGYFLSQYESETAQYIDTILLIDNNGGSSASDVYAEDGILITGGGFEGDTTDLAGGAVVGDSAGGDDFFLSTFTIATSVAGGGENEGNTDGGNTNGTTHSGSSGATLFEATSCSAAPPERSADLFQLDAYSTSVTLQINPSHGMNVAMVGYGLGDNVDQYATKVVIGSFSGVQALEINALLPNTEYSFRVLALNDCKPADWSQTLKVKTLSKPGVKPKSVYFYH